MIHIVQTTSTQQNKIGSNYPALLDEDIEGSQEKLIDVLSNIVLNAIKEELNGTVRYKDKIIVEAGINPETIKYNSDNVANVEIRLKETIPVWLANLYNRNEKYHHYNYICQKLVYRRFLDEDLVDAYDEN